MDYQDHKNLKPVVRKKKFLKGPVFDRIYRIIFKNRGQGKGQISLLFAPNVSSIGIPH